jgi:hypothetical protein
MRLPRDSQPYLSTERYNIWSIFILSVKSVVKIFAFPIGFHGKQTLRASRNEPGCDSTPRFVRDNEPYHLDVAEQKGDWKNRTPN